MSELKVGMIGLDTSHCEAFVKLLNYKDDANHVAGAKVVKAFPGGSQIFAASRDRVGGFTKTLQEQHGIEICDSIAGAAAGMDAIFLESVDGRQHLEQFRELAKFGKPVFIDKPMACSPADAKAIAALAKSAKVPVFTASAIRYAVGSSGLVKPGVAVQSCEAWGPMSILPDFPGFYWYGIHSAEMLYAYMGCGCRQVRVVHSDNLDLIVGEWADGRVGTLRGTRIKGIGFGCAVWTEAGMAGANAVGNPPYYAMLLREVLPFFQTGVSPIAIEESVEIVSFLDAANRALETDGRPVALA